MVKIHDRRLPQGRAGYPLTVRMKETAKISIVSIVFRLFDTQFPEILPVCGGVLGLRVFCLRKSKHRKIISRLADK